MARWRLAGGYAPALETGLWGGLSTSPSGTSVLTITACDVLASHQCPIILLPDNGEKDTAAPASEPGTGGQGQVA